MNADRLSTYTPALAPATPFQPPTAFHTPAAVTPFNGPPSARGGVPMTPFRSFQRSTGGGDTYFPTMPLMISPIPEESPIKSIPSRPGVQVRMGGFLSPPLLGGLPKASSPISAVPRTTSPLAMCSFPPSQQESTSPGGNRGPSFNFAVAPPLTTEGDPREPSPVDDYVNASYVQPLGTRKRYIATQGPLPATFVDFWT